MIRIFLMLISPCHPYYHNLYPVITPTEIVVEDSAPKAPAFKDVAPYAFGAVAVGAAALRPEYIYTHKGRFPEDYGREVSLDHPSAIVFLVEMDFDAMQHAPAVEVLLESARQYHQAAVISKTASHIACSAAVHSHLRLLIATLAVSYSLRLPNPFVTTPSTNHANDGMYFGSGLPVAMIIAIAPTNEPVLKNVPTDVLAWSPIKEPTFVEPVSIGRRPSSITETVE